MDNKCSETPASHSSLDSLLWYAIGIDENSSIRIQQSLLVGELSDGTLILNNEKVSLEMGALADEEPKISLRINECNELILELANGSFEVFVGNQPKSSCSLQSGDQIKLPNNQFFVSHSLFGEAEEGRIIEVKAAASESIKKLVGKAVETNESANLLNHPLILNELAIQEGDQRVKEKQSAAKVMQADEIPQLASIISAATENTREHDKAVLPSEDTVSAGYHWHIAIAASVILAGLSIVFLFSSSSDEGSVLLAESSVQAFPVEALGKMESARVESERQERVDQQKVMVLPSEEGVIVSKVPVKTEKSVDAKNRLQDPAEEFEMADLHLVESASKDVAADKANSDATSVWAEAYFLKGDVISAAEESNPVEEIELFEETPESEVLDDRLLRAKEKLERGDIITPIGKSAVTYLNWYLSENPEDHNAKLLLKQCAQKLVEQAEDDYAHNKTYEARNTLEEVFAFDPYNEHALALWKGWHGQPWSGS